MIHNHHANFEISNLVFDNGIQVMKCFFTVNPVVVNGWISNKTNYTGFLKLGQKFDLNETQLAPRDGQVCNLDEFYSQKYARRLKQLTNDLIQFVKDFSCANNLLVTSITLFNEIDTHDEDIDFVVCNLTFQDEI
ncbi:MAG: hypothetical protein ACRC0V_07530 [Fusobacteriaceae bacterium]